MTADEPGRTLGHALIDSDHQRLFDLIHTLRSLRPSDYPAIREELGKLTEYIEIHFRHEEELMDACEYPPRADHRALHEAFRNEVKVLKGLGDNAYFASAEVAITVLEHWVREHICEQDRQLVEFLNSQRAR